jgi:hypothetical protein
MHRPSCCEFDSTSATQCSCALLDAKAAPHATITIRHVDAALTVMECISPNYRSTKGLHLVALEESNWWKRDQADKRARRERQASEDRKACERQKKRELAEERVLELQR